MSPTKLHFNPRHILQSAGGRQIECLAGAAWLTFKGWMKTESAKSCFSEWTGMRCSEKGGESKQKIQEFQLMVKQLMG